MGGFTLIEAAMVLLIAGVLMGGLGVALTSYLQGQRMAMTQKRMEAIRGALQQFVQVNHRLPCPAPLDARVDTAGFGKEDSLGVCAGSGNFGTERAEGRDKGMVRIGTVPVRSLSLPDRYIADGWDSRFTYAVSESLTSLKTYDETLGAVAIIDSTGKSLVTPPGSAHYILISHGKDKAGTYSGSGVPFSACPADDETFDQENCDNDSTFISTIQREGNKGPVSAPSSSCESTIVTEHENVKSFTHNAACDSTMASGGEYISKHFDDHVMYTNTDDLRTMTCPAGQVMTGLSVERVPECVPWAMSCPQGYVMRSIDRDGTPGCVLAASTCPPGQLIMAINEDGSPLCADISGCPEPVYITGVDSDGNAICTNPPPPPVELPFPGSGTDSPVDEGKTGGGLGKQEIRIPLCGEPDAPPPPGCIDTSL